MLSFPDKTPTTPFGKMKITKIDQLSALELGMYIYFLFYLRT